MNKFIGWILAKLDKHNIKIYRGYDCDETSRDWAQ